MKKYTPPLCLLCLVVLFWEGAVRALRIDSFILPAPSRILAALFSARDLLLMHSLQTVYEALAGFLLAVVFGAGLAVIMGRFSPVKKALYPLVVISQTIPIMAVAPLLIIWFGYDMAPKVIVVALVCFFPITVSLVEGLAGVDADMVRLVLAMGGTPWQVLRKIQVPAALPSFFAGLKISATYCITGAVIAEWLGAARGIGVFMTRSMNSFLTEQVFAAIVVISILSLLLFLIVEGTGRLAMPWFYDKQPEQE